MSSFIEITSAQAAAQPSAQCIQLAQWMAGDFSNKKQSDANPKLYAHIHVFFRPLPVNFFGGIGFYSEQVFDYDLWTPYRQGIHRVIDRADQVYIENYGLKDAIRFAGAARELSILQTIAHDSIERRYNCSMVFWKEGDRYIGQVEGQQCLIERNGCSTYLVSDVEVTEQTWASLDRGMDLESHAQVWGSEHGALQFEKVQSFAHEVWEG
jgi:CpeT protein